MAGARRMAGMEVTIFMVLTRRCTFRVIFLIGLWVEGCVWLALHILVLVPNRTKDCVTEAP